VGTGTQQEVRIPRVVNVHTAANVIGENVASNHQVQVTNTSSSNNQVKFNKPQRQYINQLVECPVKKTKGEANVDESDDNDDWSKGMTASEHMYVLSAAQSEQHTDETELEIDADDLKDFRKRFKAVRKKIKMQLYGK
jgi:hypothetical protein